MNGLATGFLVIGLMGFPACAQTSGTSSASRVPTATTQRTCDEAFADHAIDPVRGKITIDVKDITPAMRTNPSFATSQDQPALDAWLRARKECAQTPQVEQLGTQYQRVLQGTDELIVQLRAGKITYGQFNTMRTKNVAQGDRERRAEQLFPLQDYVNQPNIEKDPAALGYVFHRCCALYAVVVKIFESETDPERVKLRNSLTDRVNNFTRAAIRLMMKGTNLSEGEAEKKVLDLIADLANLYGKRIESTRLRTNNMFDDPLIGGDMAVCKTLAAQLSND